MFFFDVEKLTCILVSNLVLSDFLHVFLAFLAEATGVLFDFKNIFKITLRKRWFLLLHLLSIVFQ